MISIDALQDPALPDGSVLVAEMARGALTRVGADGAQTIVAHLGGGPNGAAIYVQ